MLAIGSRSRKWVSVPHTSLWYYGVLHVTPCSHSTLSSAIMHCRLKVKVYERASKITNQLYAFALFCSFNCAILCEFSFFHQSKHILQGRQTNLLAFLLPTRHLSRLFFFRHTDFRRGLQWRRRAALAARRWRRQRSRSRTCRRREGRDTRWPRQLLCGVGVRPGGGTKSKCGRRR